MVATNELSQQRVRVYRLYTQIDNDVRRMQICVAEQLVIEDSCLRAARGPFELNVWPARFALFEAVRPTGSVLGEMIRVPQEQENDHPNRLEMPTPSYFTWD